MTYQILAGLDGSPAARAALRWAIGEARARGGEVTALYAWESPLLAYPGTPDPVALEHEAEDFLLKVVKEEAPQPLVQLRAVLTEGDPAEALVRAAHEADLVVLGNSGHPLRPGSPRHACNARCECPVVLVRQ